MNPESRYPARGTRRDAEPPRLAREAQRRRYSSGRPVQSTKVATAKLVTLGVVATLAIGGLIAAQMAAGSDPALGPKAADRTKTSPSKATSASGGRSPTSDSAGDPYAQTYGDDGYYGSNSGYSPDSTGSSGSSAYSYSPPPVTSSTS